MNVCLSVFRISSRLLAGSISETRPIEPGSLRGIKAPALFSTLFRVSKHQCPQHILPQLVFLLPPSLTQHMGPHVKDLK